MRDLPDQLAIGQLARLTSMPAKTLRFYVAIGLLPRPLRGANGYRRYTAADVNRVHLVCLTGKIPAPSGTIVTR
jgi:DNA-binding transcriptional MerR regulator